MRWQANLGTAAQVVVERPAEYGANRYSNVELDRGQGPVELGTSSVADDPGTGSRLHSHRALETAARHIATTDPPRNPSLRAEAALSTNSPGSASQPADHPVTRELFCVGVISPNQGYDCGSTPPLELPGSVGTTSG